MKQGYRRQPISIDVTSCRVLTCASGFHSLALVAFFLDSRLLANLGNTEWHYSLVYFDCASISITTSFVVQLCIHFVDVCMAKYYLFIINVTDIIGM